jgi:hypothetical protein
MKTEKAFAKANGNDNNTNQLLKYYIDNYMYGGEHEHMLVQSHVSTRVIN